MAVGLEQSTSVQIDSGTCTCISAGQDIDPQPEMTLSDLEQRVLDVQNELDLLCVAIRYASVQSADQLLSRLGTIDLRLTSIKFQLHPVSDKATLESVQVFGNVITGARYFILKSLHWEKWKLVGSHL